MERANKNAMLALSLRTGEVEIEGLGAVLCRELTRFEMVEVQELEGDRQAQDQRALFFGIVDPELSMDEVAAFRKAWGNAACETIARKVNALSGIGKDAAKSDLPSDGERSDAGV